MKNFRDRVTTARSCMICWSRGIKISLIWRGRARCRRISFRGSIMTRRWWMLRTRSKRRSMESGRLRCWIWKRRWGSCRRNCRLHCKVLLNMRQRSSPKLVFLVNELVRCSWQAKPQWVRSTSLWSRGHRIQSKFKPKSWTRIPQASCWQKSWRNNSFKRLSVRSASKPESPSSISQQMMPQANWSHNTMASSQKDPVKGLISRNQKSSHQLLCLQSQHIDQTWCRRSWLTSQDKYTTSITSTRDQVDCKAQSTQSPTASRTAAGSCNNQSTWSTELIKVSRSSPMVKRPP